MNKPNIPTGTVHQTPADLGATLVSSPKALSLWSDITPLARNEFLCWIESAKQEKTRERRIGRTIEELLDGQRRPCCWVGCIHRTDKAPGKWQQDVLIDKKPKT